MLGEMRALVGSALVLVAAALSSDAAAFPHVVRSGETVAQIAEQTYGRVELERVIVTANGMEGTSRLVAGMRLELPAVGYHRVSPGETWHSIAAQSLGRSYRGAVLAQLNDSQPWEPPAIGREIVVPYNLRYVASRGDSTQTVAYRFLGKRDEAWIVAMYNDLDSARLRHGEPILVPLTDLKLTDAGRQAARNAGAVIRVQEGGAALEAQRRTDKELPLLADDVRRGRYIEAVRRGATMLASEGLSEPQLASTQRLLTEAYVALGVTGLATTACIAWGKHDPERHLDPIDVSPKILKVCVGGVGPADAEVQ